MLDLKAIFDSDEAEHRLSGRMPVPPRVDPDDLPAEWHFLWDERAAIKEFCGGLSRERTEAQALAEIAELMRHACSSCRPDAILPDAGRGGRRDGVAENG